LCFAMGVRDCGGRKENEEKELPQSSQRAQRTQKREDSEKERWRHKAAATRKE
jgi:hypothetical protein